MSIPNGNDVKIKRLEKKILEEKEKDETITVNREKLKTLVTSLDASYKVFENEEEATINYINAELINGPGDDQIHGGIMLMQIGEWNLGLTALTEFQDLLNPNKKKIEKKVKEIKKEEKSEEYFTNSFGERMKRQTN